MLIVGDLSGIQDYLLDVADHAGGQSRRLRARSFFLQAITEMAALRILRAAEWTPDQALLRAAGKFILHGPQLTPTSRERVEKEEQGIAHWLLQRSGAKLRLSLALEEGSSPPSEQYHRAMRALQQAKNRPLSHVMIENNAWNTADLILSSIAPVCDICKRRRAAQSDTDSDGQTLSLCDPCGMDMKLGRELPSARWMTATPNPHAAPFDIAGLGVTLHTDKPAPSPDTHTLFDLSGEIATPPILSRRLGRHIPALDFDAIAETSRGAPYLGVLKMDVDSLGKTIYQLLQGADSLQPLADFSNRLDTFFARELDKEMEKPPWATIYTVFSGGDDLLLVGPWNVLFDYAYHVRQLFQQTFGKEELTISAGMAVVPRKTPIRRAVEQAEHLLETAKTEPPGQGRDQFAAFGQVWKWKHHEAIAFWAQSVTRWVEDDAAERGWLQTLLRMTEAREKEPLTTAHLVYHVERNYPRSNDPNPGRQSLRNWIDQIARDFDTQQRVETRYLPTILRYALTATRKGETQ